MGLRQEAEKAYAYEQREKMLKQQEENAEKEAWIINRLIERFGKDTIEDSNVVSNNGYVTVDGITFRATKEHEKYVLSAEFHSYVWRDPTLEDIGSVVAEAKRIGLIGG